MKGKVRNWLLGILEKERDRETKKLNGFLASLPQEVRLLKDLPGIKAGVTLALNEEGIYVCQLPKGETTIMYDYLTVGASPDWFQPLEDIDHGRWFDG